jgi:hypothetical protein
MYPSSIGPSPLYSPRMPSSTQIVRAVPDRPLYTTRAGPDPWRRWKEPCACRRVLITSSGQVTIPEATPAEAPHSALIGPSGSFDTLTARAAKGLLQLLRSVVEVMSREPGAATFGAYRSETIVGDGGSGLCSDIGGAVTDWLDPCCSSVYAVVRWKGSVLAVVPSGVPQCAETPQHSSNTVASGWAAPLTGGAMEESRRQSEM